MKPQIRTTPSKQKSLKNPTGSVFFDNIKAKRKERGLTQQQLAEKIGTKHTRISELENGAFVESPDKLIAIAKALDCSLDWLFGLKTEGNRDV